MTARILNRDEINAYYEDQMSFDEQQTYHQFGDRKITRAFHGKLFVIYSLSVESLVPAIITNLRVTNIAVINNDVVLSFLDLKTGKTCQLSYMPQLICGYDVFGAVPSECMVSKILKETPGKGIIDVGLSAGILIRHRMKPEFKKPGFVYCLSVPEFERLFGEDGVRAFEKLEHDVKDEV